MVIRLDKYICDMGCASRREVKELARKGKITVDGETVRDPAYKVDTALSEVSLCGEIIGYDDCPVYMMNKPAGLICSNEDGRDRTVMELLSERDSKKGLFTIGRLDRDTVGLLLLTTDGELSHRLLSPKNHVWKTYFFKCDPPLEQSDIKAFSEGVYIESGIKSLPAKLTILDDPARGLLTIREGRFHQVKKMLAAVKKNCTYLERVQFGPLTLDKNLARGEYRTLTEDEKKALKNIDLKPFATEK